MSPLIKKRRFLRAFFDDLHVAAISPSSHFLVQKALKALPSPLNLVIEQGPGEGSLTKEILKKLSPNGRLFLIEQNKNFIPLLKALNDPRITIFEGLAQDFPYESLLPHTEVDLIISSIPFSFLEKKEREEICAQAYAHLKKGGQCIIFHQYSTLMKQVIQKYFGTSNVTFVLWNVFPCFIIRAKK